MLKLCTVMLAHMQIGWFRIGALLCAIGVAAGAFGAHGLKRILTEEMLQVYQTGVQYHLLHALALTMVAATPLVGTRGPLWLFAIGILLFSGSLYLLALTDIRWLGAITPLGGTAFIGAWVWLAVKATTLTPP